VTIGFAFLSWLQFAGAFRSFFLRLASLVFFVFVALLRYQHLSFGLPPRVMFGVSPLPSREVAFVFRVSCRLYIRPSTLFVIDRDFANLAQGFFCREATRLMSSASFWEALVKIKDQRRR